MVKQNKVSGLYSAPITYVDKLIFPGKYLAKSDDGDNWRDASAIKSTRGLLAIGAGSVPGA